MIDFPPDWTFFFQIVLFLFVWTALRRLLFEPNLAVLDARKKRSATALKDAERIRTEATEIEKRYTDSLAATRSATMQEVDELYRQAEDSSRLTIESARESADAEIATLRENLRTETTETRRRLETQTADFAGQIGEKLLGRPPTRS